jgi:hypothetical protein
MGHYEIRLLLGGIAMFFAVSTSFLVRKENDISIRILMLLVVLATINEVVATIFAYRIGNSNIVYGFYNPVELFLICLYFNYSVDNFKKKRVGYVVGVLCLLIGYINYFVIQSPKELNNFYLLFESLIVVFLCLYSFYRMLLSDDSLILTDSSHFWITTNFLFYWTSTLFLWGTYGYLTKSAGIANSILLNVLLIVNMVTYSGFGVIFISYKKLQNVNGR